MGPPICPVAHFHAVPKAHLGYSLSPPCGWGEDCKGNHSFSYQPSSRTPTWARVAKSKASAPDLSDEVTSHPRTAIEADISDDVSEEKSLVKSAPKKQIAKSAPKKEIIVISSDESSSTGSLII